MHTKGQVDYRWEVLLVARRRVAVGSVCSSTMFCFLPTHLAAPVDRRRADDYLRQVRHRVVPNGDGIVCWYLK